MKLKVWVIGIIGLGIIFSGCAIFQSSSVKDTEEMLSVAGFKVKLADTPEKLEHLKGLSQHKLIPREKDGKVYYFYADAHDKQHHRQHQGQGPGTWSVKSSFRGVEKFGGQKVSFSSGAGPP